MNRDILQPQLVKMLLVNSGRFDYAIIDVDKSMHFHGEIMHRKTTLVNALQFLLLTPSINGLGWEKTSKDTRKYYFKTNSYIVFEVSIQLDSMSGGNWERRLHLQMNLRYGSICL